MRFNKFNVYLYFNNILSINTTIPKIIGIIIRIESINVSLFFFFAFSTNIGFNVLFFSGG